MIDGVPLPKSGVLQKGVIYRVPAPPREPKRQLDPETLALIERIQRAQILEYMRRRRGS